MLRLMPVYGSQKGFSLIEMLVAISIFSIIILIILGIFSRFVIVQRRDIGEFRLQEELRLAIELFNREARTGFGNTFVTEASAVVFRNQRGQCVTYRGAGQALQRAEQEQGGQTCAIITDNQLFQSLTSSQTLITQLQFDALPARVSADGARLESQGVLTMSVKATAKTKADTVMALQNTVTARQLIPFRPL